MHRVVFGIIHEIELYVIELLVWALSRCCQSMFLTFCVRSNLNIVVYTLLLLLILDWKSRSSSLYRGTVRSKQWSKLACYGRWLGATESNNNLVRGEKMYVCEMDRTFFSINLVVFEKGGCWFFLIYRIFIVFEKKNDMVFNSRIFRRKY